MTELLIQPGEQLIRKKIPVSLENHLEDNKGKTNLLSFFFFFESSSQLSRFIVGFLNFNNLQGQCTDFHYIKTFGFYSLIQSRRKAKSPGRERFAVDRGCCARKWVSLARCRVCWAACDVRGLPSSGPGGEQGGTGSCSLLGSPK